jgi:hypothetical protein
MTNDLTNDDLPFTVNIEDEVVGRDGDTLADLNNDTFDAALAFQRDYVRGLRHHPDAGHPAFANLIRIEEERLRQLEVHNASEVRRKKRALERGDGTPKRVTIDVLLGENALQSQPTTSPVTPRQEVAS